MNDKRSVQMDIIKGLGIIAIVIGHTKSPLFKFVYAYHVVLFFFISGYFYKENYTKNPIVLIKKRIRTLYLPFIKYELIFLIFHNLFVKLNLYNYKYYHVKDFMNNIIKILTFHEVQSEILGQFWFIKVLFITNIMFALINFIIYKINFKSKEKIKFIFIFILFIVDVAITRYISKDNNNFSVPTFSLVAVSLLAFCTGNIYKKYKSYIKLNIYFFAISLLIIVINCMAVGTNMGNFYKYPLIFIVNSVLGIYFNIFLAEVLLRKNKYNFIVYIGKNSLIILALHMFSFKIINFVQILIYRLNYSYLSKRAINDYTSWWIIYSLAGIFIPIMIVSCLNKVLLLFKHNKFLRQVN